MRTLALAVVTMGAFGCASTSAKPAFDETARTVAERSGQRLVWSEHGESDREVERAVADLLARPLTVSGAVQVALLRNRHLQATFEDLGIAQADLVQAGLLKNPTLFGSIHFPISPNAVADATLTGAFDLIDAFMVPAKKHVAASRLAATKARVADSVLELARDAAAAYYAAVGAAQVLSMRRSVLEAGEAATELARRLATAGNVGEGDLANRETELEALSLDTLRSEAACAEAREMLTRKLGLYGAATAYLLPDKLSELPKVDALPDHLETLAVTSRLDLVAAHEDAQAISYELAMTKNFRLLGLLGPFEGTYEKTFAGSEVAGPGGTVELPIFDQKQAWVARLEARRRQALDLEEALAVDVRSEARVAIARVLFARGIVERYRTHLVPLRERVVELTQERYNAMLAGVFQLVLAKQAEVGTYSELIDAIRDYWVARVDLERAVGGRVGAVASATPPPTPTSPPMHDMKNMQH